MQAEERKLLLSDVKELYRIIGRYEILSVFNLSDREMLIVKKRWDECLSYEKIANEMELSQERVRQIYSKAIMRLRTRISVAIDKYKLLHNLMESNRALIKENTALKKRFEALDNAGKQKFGNPEAMLIEFENLPLSTRLQNALCVAQIKTIGDALNTGRNTLYKFRNFGSKSMAELETIIEQHGFKLKN